MQIITISRGSLSGAKKLSEHLSRELEIPIYKREEVFEEAEKYAISETGFCDISFIDRAPTVMERQYYRRKHYLLSFQVALLDLVVHGSCIYEGHLGQYLLTSIPFILRIRVIQPFEKRVTNWMQKHNINHEQALNYIKLVDERRKHWSEFLYGVDIEDPKYYDLIINLDTMNVNTATTIVKNALEQPEYNSKSETLKMLKNLHLAAKTKLYLYLSPVTRGIEVDVKADERVSGITIEGLSKVMDSDKYESHIRNVLGKYSDYKKIEFSY